MMQIYGKYRKICYNIWKESVGKETSIMKKNRTIKQTIEFYVMAVAIYQEKRFMGMMARRRASLIRSFTHICSRRAI